MTEVEPQRPEAGSSDRCNLPRPAVFLGGYGRFVAVTAEAFAASRRSWRRSLPLRGGHGGGLLYIDTKTTQKIASHATSAFFITGTCLGFAPLHGTCAARRFFRRNHRKKEEKSRKKATSTGRGRWSCGGLRRAALEVTAVFCGHGRWFVLEVFPGFSIWRLKRHNPWSLICVRRYFGFSS